MGGLHCLAHLSLLLSQQTRSLAVTSSLSSGLFERIGLYSKVASATLSIPYESTLLMQGTQYPTSNLVMSQLHQMISALEMPKITYVHTAQKETISIHEALEKAVMPEKMKLILKARTQMVESIYKYFELDLSESHRAKLYICTLLDPRFKKFNYWPTRKYVNNSKLCTECI